MSLESTPGPAMGSPIQKVESPIMDEFDANLERFNRWLDMMQVTLGPVLLMDESPNAMVESAPREVPQSELHRKVQELGYLLSRAESLRARVRV